MSSRVSFEGQTAVITGAGSGIGRALALNLAERGCHLALADIREQTLAETVEMLECHRQRRPQLRVSTHLLDVASREAIDAFPSAVLSEHSTVNLLFNNAGVGSGGLVWENTVADWQWVLGVNVWGVVHGVRLFTPMMLEAAKKDPAYEGHIVNTASMAGLLTAPNMGVYNVSKHAVVALTETLYQDLKLVTDQVSAIVRIRSFAPGATVSVTVELPNGSGVKTYTVKLGKAPSNG